MKKILFMAGTRPEIIKIYPIIKVFKESEKYRIIFGLTGQHKELSEQALNFYQVKPDFNLHLQTDNQSLSKLTAKALSDLENILHRIQPDLIVIQGDTTTTLACGLSAFYQQIPVAHIEAGLRTGNNYSPFPEEVNRKVTSIISRYHFAPTERARENLLAEGNPSSRIFVVGNTVIDALIQILAEIQKPPNFKRIINNFSTTNGIVFTEDKKIVLVTLHRRENYGKILEQICLAIQEIAMLYKEIQIIIPVHPNPNIKRIITDSLKDINNISLIHPLDYESFIFLMTKSYLILTDSGGIQEEAVRLNKPVIILRKQTERMESIEVGGAVLGGTDRKIIVKIFTDIYTNKTIYLKMSQAENPYGDGKASQYIFDIIDLNL